MPPPHGPPRGNHRHELTEASGCSWLKSDLEQGKSGSSCWGPRPKRALPLCSDRREGPCLLLGAAGGVVRQVHRRQGALRPCTGTCPWKALPRCVHVASVHIRTPNPFGYYIRFLKTGFCAVCVTGQPRHSTAGASGSRADNPLPRGQGRALWSDWLVSSVYIINTCIVHVTQSHCLTHAAGPPCLPGSSPESYLYVPTVVPRTGVCHLSGGGSGDGYRALTLRLELRGELRVWSHGILPDASLRVSEQGLPGAAWFLSWTLNLREAPRVRQKTGEEPLGEETLPWNINGNSHPYGFHLAETGPAGACPIG